MQPRVKEWQPLFLVERNRVRLFAGDGAAIDRPTGIIIRHSLYSEASLVHGEASPSVTLR